LTATTRRAPAPLDLFACALEGTTLVEASAGTGKTWNICGLYLRLLLERDLDVRQILVVTFTNAATAELRTRIRDRIGETLRHARDGTGDDAFVRALLSHVASRTGRTRGEIAARLELAQNSLDEAAICTIHAFASRALADTPFAAGLPFEVDLTADDSAIRQEVVNDFWRRRVASDACAPALASYLVDRNDSPETFARIVARRMAKPFARLRFPDVVEAPTIDAATVSARYRDVRELWSRHRREFGALFARLPDKTLHGNVYSPNAIARAISDWDVWLRADDPLARFPRENKLALLTSARLAECTGDGRPTPVHPFFAAATGLLEAIDATNSDLASARLRLIRDLVDECPAALRRRKREMRVAGYDDLLDNLHHALGSRQFPGMPERLRAQYPAALIDEFQDTDPTQFGIFRAIYRGSGAPVFLVGDPKQSIYGFRNADLYTYFEAAGEVDAHYTLLTNQRATQALIDAQNTLFGANARAFALAELDYRAVTAGTRRRAALDDRSEPRAAMTVWTLRADENGAAVPRAEARAAAVRATASEIARLLRGASDDRIRLDDRRLAASDIAVLVRTHAQGMDVKDALAALGVGSVELAQESIFRTPDADEVACVLNAVLEPSRAPVVRSALATQIFGCDARRIDALSDDDAASSLYVDRLVEYRALWLQRGFAAMYRRLLRDEGVIARMLARDDGERRMTNLLHLGEALQDAAASGKSPDALVRWLAAQRNEHARDDSRELRLESDRNLVHIVTIHKAKGLEYPIVFCPFFFEGGYWQPRADVREYHDGSDAVLDFTPIDKHDPRSIDIDEAVQYEAMAERLRLAYVALTRAVQRCYLTAGLYTTHGRSLKESARSLSNWLVAGDGADFRQWIGDRFDKKPGAARLDARVARIGGAWRAFGEHGAPHLALVPMPVGDGVPLPRPATDPATIVARKPPPRIAEGWRVGSFSALAQGVASDMAAIDHDARVIEPDDDRRTTPPSSDDIVFFPRGAAAGECLHAVLERADFERADAWPAIVAQALSEFPPGRSDADDARHAAMVQRMLRDLVATPLPIGGAESLMLRTVTWTRRLAELGFTFPARGLDTARLRGTLGDAGYTLPHFTARELDGYLSGYIDLVFEHGGRYYVVDWKSNHLGERAIDYARPAIAAAMREQGYHLQQMIYAVALDRYLQHRVRGYAHAAHFGGVLYLFVRGVRPDWRDADGAPTGVYFDRPGAATLQRVAAALGASSTVESA
jgi:exodeoxyribonuclease V beta subunit